jgi:hypothetical protein
MVSHRVRIEIPAEIDKELLTRLKQANQKALRSSSMSCPRQLKSTYAKVLRSNGELSPADVV